MTGLAFTGGRAMTSKGNSRWLVLAAALVAAAPILTVSSHDAAAQRAGAGKGGGKDDAKKRALERWEKGNQKFNLGAFDEAIKEFTAAYEEYPAPEFLFNIGQCYRQLNDCDRAVFFYKRYLSGKPDANNRAEVEQRISELTK